MNRTTTLCIAVCSAALVAGLGGWLLTRRDAPLVEVSPQGQRLVRDGVSIEFQMNPIDGHATLMEGNFADVRFKVTESKTGQPLSGIAPGAWLDPSLLGLSDSEPQNSCKSRVAMFLKNNIGARPLLDLTRYFLLVLNKDASLTVIDPTVSVGGTTSTLKRIDLKQPPMDWVRSGDNKRVFVSMPAAGEIAVIDTEKFQVLGNIAAGAEPLRVALQPDERLLWVGNDSRDAGSSGVTVIDSHSLKPLAHLATGVGHHEIAFSKDSRHAFVSNRDSGTLSVIDIATLTLRKQIKTGPHPLSVAYSALSEAVYVADGKDGSISVIDARSLKQLKVIKVIKGNQGLGPMRFSRDGRFGFVLNTLDNRALVIDAASDSLIHSLEVAAEPYQVTFTAGYAYIRGLSSPKVTMVNLGSLGQNRTPIIQGFEAGPAAPRQAGDLPLAQSLTSGREDNSVFVVNPVDNTTYFYAEGMNAPMSGYPNHGHTARAAMVIDLSLREVEPGLYSTRVLLPAAGRFDVAFLINQPQIIHCFTTQVEPNPTLDQSLAMPQVEFLLDKFSVPQGHPYMARLRLVQPKSLEPPSGIKDVRLRYFLAPSSMPLEVAAHEVGDGIHEAPLQLDTPGAWYLHVRSAFLDAEFGTSTYASLRVVPAITNPSAP
ncbi:YncE family protein [Pseudomonas fluorescens]|uniref:YncE family protein n=1 Tax=Pseudomonas fluorescens TaxID=294 RepID=UPI001240EFE5|nr:YncE family protein [Pseudomonas fluorescens]